MPTPFRHLCIICLITLGLTSYLFAPAPVQASQNFNQIKALFLFKFFDYVTWPSTKTNQNTICTYGKSDLNQLLQLISNNHKYQGKVTVKNINSPQNYGDCHILFLSPDNYKNISAIQRTAPLLIIGDTKEILDQGGIIELKETKGRIGLTVNLNNAKARNLTISSRLLRIADIKE